MKRSITTRLVVMFALAALGTFSLIGAALYGVLSSELVRHQDSALGTYLQNMQYSIERYGTPDRWARLQAKMDTLTPADGSVRFWVLCDDPRFQYGRGLAVVGQMQVGPGGHGSVVLPAMMPTVPGASGAVASAVPQAEPAHRFRTLARTIGPLEGRPAVQLVVGIDTAPYARTLTIFESALALLTATAVAMVMGAGYWIARVGLKPLQNLSVEARALRPRTLSQRLQQADLPVELADLAQAFNGALARLEAAYQQLEAFNADVAHELRTPLANLIGGTQVALSRQRTAEHFQDTLQSNLEELERLRSIINDMLFLARADQGEVASSLTEASVEAEVRKTIEFFEFVLDDAQTSVRVEGDLGARATLETALFRRALSNLLQNAIDHSQPGAQLVVRITQGSAAAGTEGADGVWVRVENPGAPIDPRHLPRLFDRFYRIDAARHDHAPAARGDAADAPTRRHGHGLGLAIVKAVARMHGGAVSAASARGHTTIGFSVRRAAPALPKA
jgi:two-component system heavy metal sensor histidine kinase CusS